MRIRSVLSLVFLAAGSIALPALAQKPTVPRPQAPRAGGITGSEYVIVATDQGVEAPSQVDAGLVNMRLFNRSRGMPHFVLLKVDRLDRLSAISDYLRTGDWNVPWINRMGGPESPPIGGVSSVSMVLEPGRYVLAQLPPAPVTPGQPFILGDVHEVAVTMQAGADLATELPRTEAKLTLSEWKLDLEGPLGAGRRTLRIVNKGQFEHRITVVRLLSGRTTEQAVKWAERPVGPPPYESAGGTANIAGGRSVNVAVDLIPGDYVFLCTTYNPLSRKLHTQHGMVKQVRVLP
ncbi:MAG: hypothetical protein ABIZ91_04880 [Gemmatimonadaceae bacterium]